MANVFAPFGFKQQTSATGAPSNFQMIYKQIAYDNNTPIYTGDPVVSLSDGTIGIGVAGAACRGVFMGCNIWASGLNPTSTGDKLGAIWSLDPEYAAMAYVVKRVPSSLAQTNVLMDSNIWASFARVGFGIIANNFATSIRSVNA